MFRLRNAEGDYEGHLGGTDCRGTRLRRWFWANMSSSCRSRSILEKLTMGLSTRKYRDAVRSFARRTAWRKSAIGEHFIEASQAKWKQIVERRLDKPERQRTFRSSLFQ